MTTTTTIRITPEQPYDFEATAGFAARFNDRSGADHFSGGVYTRAVEVRFQSLIFSLHSVGTRRLPELALELEHSGPPLDSEVVFATQLLAGRMLGVRQKLDGFYRQASEDWTLQELVQDFNGLHIPQTSSLFEAMVQVVMAGGLPRAQGEVAREEIVEQFGQPVGGRGFTLNAFPTDRALMDGARRLRRMRGPIGERADSIIGIAEASLAGALDRSSYEGMADSETAKFLGQLLGVDRWMTDWAMILGLGRPDVLPSEDPTMRRAVALMTGQRRLAEPERVAEFGVRWKPWRSFVTAYIVAAMRRGRDYWS